MLGSKFQTCAWDALAIRLIVRSQHPASPRMHRGMCSCTPAAQHFDVLHLQATAGETEIASNLKAESLYRCNITHAWQMCFQSFQSAVPKGYCSISTVTTSKALRLSVVKKSSECIQSPIVSGWHTPELVEPVRREGMSLTRSFQCR